MLLESGRLYLCVDGFTMVWSSLQGQEIYVMTKISPGELFVCVGEPELLPAQGTFWSRVVCKNAIGFVPSNMENWDGVTRSRRADVY